MKKYFVLKVYEYTTPSVVFQSDVEQNARDYAELMHREYGDTYVVVALI